MQENLLCLNFILKFCNNLCAFSNSFYDTHNLTQTILYFHLKLMCLFPVIFLISHFSSLICAVSFRFRCDTGLGRAAVITL